MNIRPPFSILSTNTKDKQELQLMALSNMMPGSWACVSEVNTLQKILLSMQQMQTVLTCMNAESVIIIEHYSLVFNPPINTLKTMVDTCTMKMGYQYKSGQLWTYCPLLPGIHLFLYVLWHLAVCHQCLCSVSILAIVCMTRLSRTLSMGV